MIESIPSQKCLAGLRGSTATWGLKNGPASVMETAVRNLGQWSFMIDPVMLDE